MRQRSSHGWRELSPDDKRQLLDAIASGSTPRGPLHLELDLCDRCNVDCYFCNAMDVRTKEQIPLERVVSILDEACATGLRSLRLAGGGDPLFHRDILAVLDAIHERKVVIDNVTTNGVALSEQVARRLVDYSAREIVLSLNAATPDDYARMMQVRPAVFDRVLANVRQLVEIRGDGPYPALAVQFLIDRANVSHIPEMYRLARSLGADTIAINRVLEIPNGRIERELLLDPYDVEPVRPLLREVIAEDRGVGALELCFDSPAFNAAIAGIETELNAEVRSGFETAPSFSDENGGCFFGFYTAVVRGNGDMYPCCMLMQPDYVPLGNAVTAPLLQEWNGPSFSGLRHEMREVLLAGTEIEYQPEHFRSLRPQCVDAHSCGLKNIYFRGDDDFYSDLKKVLTEQRKREFRFFGSRQQIARALRRAKLRNPKLRRAYEKLAVSLPRVRTILKRHLGVRYREEVQ